MESALQEWDLTHNQPPASSGTRFSLHQRWAGKFAAKPCAGHVLLVEVTQTFFDVHDKAVFVLRGKVKRQGQCLHVGKGGKVRK